MDKKKQNKLNDTDLENVSGGRCNPGGSKKRPRSSHHDSNANSMAANVDEPQNASGWVGKVFVPWQRPK